MLDQANVPRSQVSPCLSVLSRLLFSSDPDVLADACWALSYLSDGPNDKIQTVIDSGVCRRLVELLMWGIDITQAINLVSVLPLSNTSMCLDIHRHSDYKVVSPALRAVGNIVTGDDIQTQVVWLLEILSCPHSFKKEQFSYLLCCSVSGDSELLRTALPAPFTQQSEGIHQKRSMLDRLQYHCWEQSANPGAFSPTVTLR